MEGEVSAQGPNGLRTIPAADLFQDYLTTAVAHDEVITEVRLPASRRLGLGYEKFTRRAEDWAMVGVCALVKGGDGSCEDVRIGLTHMGLDAAARDRRRGGAARAGPRRRLDRRRRAAGRRGRGAARRPQRDARVQAPPGAGADPEGSGGCGRARSLDTPEAVREALAGERYLADRGLSTSVYLAADLEQPLLLEGEAGVGKTEVAKALAGATGAA